MSTLDRRTLSRLVDDVKDKASKIKHMSLQLKSERLVNEILNQENVRLKQEVLVISNTLTKVRQVLDGESI